MESWAAHSATESENGRFSAVAVAAASENRESVSEKCEAPSDGATRSGRLHVHEFAGLPGSGKTTLTTYIRRHGDIIGRDDLRLVLFGQNWSSRLLYVAHIALAFLVNVRLNYHMLRYGMAASGLSIGLIVQILRTSQLAYNIGLLRKRDRSRDQVVLLDQGFIQYIGSLSVPGRGPLPSSGELMRSLARGRLDGVIWLGCDSEAAARRMQGRTDGESRFEGGNPSLGDSQYRRFEAAMEAAVNGLDPAVTTTLILNGTQPLDENALRVRDWLSSSDSWSTAGNQAGVRSVSLGDATAGRRVAMMPAAGLPRASMPRHDRRHRSPPSRTGIGAA